MAVVPAYPPQSIFLTNPQPPHFPTSNTSSRPTSCRRAPPPQPTPQEFSTVVPLSLPTKCPPHTHRPRRMRLCVLSQPQTPSCLTSKMSHSCRSTPEKRSQPAIQYIRKLCPSMRGKDYRLLVKEGGLQAKLRLFFLFKHLNSSSNCRNNSSLVATK